MKDEKKDIYACTQYMCATDCKRKFIYRSPKWFSGWLEGTPKLKEYCKYYVEPDYVK